MGIGSRFAAKAAAKAAKEAAAKAAAKAAKLAVTPKAKPRQLALPAPPKQLALPAPGPGLPSFAVKPRGGQFYPDVPLRPIDAQAAGYKLDNYTDQYGVDRYQVVTPDGSRPPSYAGNTPEMGASMLKGYFQRFTPENNKSPEAAARYTLRNYGLDQRGEEPTLQGNLGNWLERTLVKYYKTDFGSPNDPLRELAERGMHYDPTMTPEMWRQSVDDSLVKTPMGFVTTPRSVKDIRAEMNDDIVESGYLGAVDPVAAGTLMQAAPWLRKQPVTDNLYGIQKSLDLNHFVDEMENALQPERSGLPLDLAVRPESLDRMTFAQAAEQVGRINQYRAKEMERTALSSLNSPAVQTFKEYADDNPMGLRWTELKAPDPEGGLPEGWQISPDRDGFLSPEGEFFYTYPGQGQYDDALQQALKYEGDTMGHCVGGYCPDVMEGRSRIFSLRDAKGEPHVTIETSPTHSRSLSGNTINEWEPGAFNRFLNQQYDYGGTDNMHEWARANFPEKMSGEDIIQIKGKQNAAPKDAYLPFVQDFVRSGQWSNVGDLRNTNLVRLPDGRYITNQQAEEGIAAMTGTRIYSNEALQNLTPEEWAIEAPYFEGYAIGGRVSADRCFSRHPMSVKQ